MSNSSEAKNVDREYQDLVDYINEVNEDGPKLIYKDVIAEQFHDLISVLPVTPSMVQMELYYLILAIKAYQFVHEILHCADEIDPHQFQLGCEPWFDDSELHQNQVHLWLVKPDMKHNILLGAPRKEATDAFEAFLAEVEAEAGTYLNARLDADEAAADSAEDSGVEL